MQRLTGAFVPIGSEREVTMKARYYRIVGSAAVMTALIAVLAAPKKWG
jgi:hypothetical protein